MAPFRTRPHARSRGDMPMPACAGLETQETARNSDPREVGPHAAMAQGGGAAFPKEAAGRRASVKLGNRGERPHDHRLGAELRESEEWCSGRSGQIPHGTARQLELPLL